VIVGAGIGGLALANGLAADGHAVRVLERAPALRADGAAVTIFSNGMAAAAGLGVALDGLGGRIDTLDFALADGRIFSCADVTELRRRTGFGVATVPRAAILQRFAAGLPDGSITYGCPVDAVEVDRTGATVAGIRADVVVGADGYRSAVRRSVLHEGPAAPNGWVSWQGLTVTLPGLARGTRARCLVGDAGLCGLMPAGDGLLQWWFDVDEPVPPDVSVLGFLRRRFGHFAEPVPELLAGLTGEDPQAYPHVLHTVRPAWGRGPVTLLGDAAHAFPPSQAQGANQALEDAWLLRRALGSGGPPAVALREYERLRARRVRPMSRLAAGEVTNRPPGWFARRAGRMLRPAPTARLHLAAIRRSSSVLNNEQITVRSALAGDSRTG
jgi:FAD-dependent urate hydroxylase